jgi:hypothetical protein
MRLERVAYKKIASHLDKTELACRLHYHQLSHGGNRRKRNNSVSSTSSSTPAASPATSPSAASPLSATKPFIATSFSPVNAAGAIQKAGNLSNPLSKIKGKPLLPKPADAATSGAGAVATPRRQHAKGGKPLRVHCNPDSIDKQKLKRLVKQNERKFWDMIAEQYGEPIDGEYLRTIWAKSFGSETPPTPAISPAGRGTSPTVDMGGMDDGNSHTVATVSEVSTPSSASLSPTQVAFSASEVESIREEPMDDLMEECVVKEQPPTVAGLPPVETAQMS